MNGGSAGGAAAGRVIFFYMAGTQRIPPFSPVLLLGMAAAPIPPAVFQPLVDRVLCAAWRRHPEIFERLEPLGDSSLLIEPVDLPFRFLLRPNERPPVLRVIAAGTVGADGGTARIRGSLLSLLELVEGRVDGDALFFSRDIAVTGDTEIVVALRNALDGTELDVLDVVCAACGPLAPVARRFAHPGLMLAQRATRHMAQIQAAITAPAMRRCDAQAAAQAALDARLTEVERRAARREPRDALGTVPGGGPA